MSLHDDVRTVSRTDELRALAAAHSAHNYHPLPVVVAEAEGADALSPEMRRFIEEAKASGVTRCPIRDIEAKIEKCPVDFKTVSPEQAKAAVDRLLEQQQGGR